MASTYMDLGLSGGNLGSGSITTTGTVTAGTVTASGTVTGATVTATTAFTSTAGYVSLGSTVGTIGDIRVANAANHVVARNAANDANIVCLSLSSGNALTVGAAHDGSGLRPATCTLDATSTCGLRVAGTLRVTCTTTSVSMALPILMNSNRVHMGASTTTNAIITGTGTPESAVTAPVGSLFLRTDGGASTVLYVKESGSGNSGWVAK